MEPTTVATAITEVAKAADKIPFTALMSRMLGPAADELAERWRVSIRVYRYGNQLKLMKKAEKMAMDAGFTPKAVPIKLLFPLLEGASLEEDEDLQTMWAALLANAANPDTPDLVHPSFMSTLQHLGRTDALLLERISQVAIRKAPLTDAKRNHLEQLRKVLFTEEEMFQHYSGLGKGKLVVSDLSEEEPIMIQINVFSASTCFNTLQAEHLIEHRFDLMADANSKHSYSITSRGYEFVRACSSPNKK